jgi:hypothetical protein
LPGVATGDDRFQEADWRIEFLRMNSSMSVKRAGCHVNRIVIAFAVSGSTVPSYCSPKAWSSLHLAHSHTENTRSSTNCNRIITSLSSSPYMLRYVCLQASAVSQRCAVTTSFGKVAFRAGRSSYRRALLFVFLEGRRQLLTAAD